MGKFCCLVEEDVLNHDAFHGGKRRCDVLRVGVGLNYVFSLAVQAFEGAVQCGLKHVWNAQARLWAQSNTPAPSNNERDGGVRNMPIARQFMREGAHVAATLHIILTT